MKIKIKRKELLFLIIIFTVFSTLAYSGWVLYRTVYLYSYIKSNSRSLVGKVHKADEDLGYAPIPGAQGAEVFGIGPEIPMRYDEKGFRAPLDTVETPSLQRPLVLALGCSWTYGTACLAENTYPYLVGQLLGGSSINAGYCGYGLSQMVILARRLIPLYRPDYLLVQLSPWLVVRAQTGFMPTYFGKVPTPYFFETQGNLKLHPPVFKAKIYDLPIHKYRQTEKSAWDFISFQFCIALPLLAYEDLKMSIYTIKKILKIIPPPADGQMIMKDVYKEIIRIAEENGSKPILILLLLPFNKAKEWVILEKHIKEYVNKTYTPQDPNIVNAYSALIEHLPTKLTKSYVAQYCHLRGSPPRVVDTHPNAYAHSIIAEEIVSVIQFTRAGRDEPSTEDQHGM
jgi:hypothetical protein